MIERHSEEFSDKEIYQFPEPSEKPHPTSSVGTRKSGYLMEN
jgi:hypothetical protein